MITAMALTAMTTTIAMYHNDRNATVTTVTIV
jgi:hypothetical protein